MDFSHWLSLVTICLLGAMSPGPSLAMVLRHSLAGGRRYGFAVAWAHACGIGFYAWLTLTGLAALLAQSPRLFAVISYAGAAYLAYLGIKALRSRGGIDQQLKSGDSMPVSRAMRDGLMISLLSPKIALFFIALFSQFIALDNSAMSRSVLVVTPLLVDGLWYSLVTLLISSPLLLQRLRLQAKTIDRLSGVVLIALAARVVWGV
ncbi:LysE family translocator [Aliagarivorans marinus]|uniref:LysE family translocator n=1 Tax=Aliagarivorans marinus TaxID=561965 RepID=UPI0003F60E49|nr:LysE family translocator [Aliagarivorans marinus]